MKSFYAPPPPRERAGDLLEDYEAFLRERNGCLHGPGGFERRHALMADIDGGGATYRGEIDVARFAAAYHRFDARHDLSEDLVALLAFVKVNACEAYGVEVTARARAHLHARDEPLYRLEGILSREEDWHTRILVGATRHFEGLAVGGAWRPPAAVRLLVNALAVFPPVLFHPVFLGAEISGVFLFDWTLRRLATLLPHDPAVRESMERRLIEVLVDEVGHIAFNRIACGPAGVRTARPIAGMVHRGVVGQLPEFAALGFDHTARHTLSAFDYAALPEEVRRRAFFV